MFIELIWVAFCLLIENWAVSYGITFSLFDEPVDLTNLTYTNDPQCKNVSTLSHRVSDANISKPFYRITFPLSLGDQTLDLALLAKVQSESEHHQMSIAIKDMAIAVDPSWIKSFKKVDFKQPKILHSQPLTNDSKILLHCVFEHDLQIAQAIADARFFVCVKIHCPRSASCFYFIEIQSYKGECEIISQFHTLSYGLLRARVFLYQMQLQKAAKCTVINYRCK